MIDSFHGEYDWLSNFSPVSSIELDDIPGKSKLYFSSVEAAYQAAKTIVYSERLPFRIMSPGQAKRAGKDVTLRADWYGVRLGIMANLCAQKFIKYPYEVLLLSTGTQKLVEGNNWNDTFWGVCDGKGRNELGKILMSIREGLVSKVLPYICPLCEEPQTVLCVCSCYGE